MNKNYCSKKDSASIEISAWDYGIRERGRPGKSGGIFPMVNEDDAWKFILKCQR